MIGRLQGVFQDRLTLLPVLWEDEPLEATSGFQDQIDRRTAPSRTDIALFILWSRLGTALGDGFALDDGRIPTGTEWEFEKARQASSDDGTPYILVYRKQGPPEIRADLPQEQLLQRHADWNAVGTFFQRYFQAEDLSFVGSYHTFSDSVEFGERLEMHLTRVLTEKKLGTAAQRVTWHGCPFRGLETFEFEHGPIFFGRSRAVHQVRAALAEQVKAGTAFALILGASGSGKSSLARAGMLPLLTGPRAIEESLRGGFCRRAVMRPADAQLPITALAEALFESDALPELAESGDAQDLASIFVESPRAAAAQVKSALGRAAAALGSETTQEGRLILVVDQLEELWTREGVDDQDRSCFVAVIDALARSGNVWVIATLRSDFYSALQTNDTLRTLKGKSGQIDLVAPDAGEVAQIVRRPAQVAGLTWEKDGESGRTLDELLLNEASEGPDALPLLEYALSMLWERREGTTLTIAAYRQLGGIDGALAERAERVWAELPRDAQAAFAVVLRTLVEVGAGERTITRRRAPRSEVITGPGAESLVDQMLAARLLVADGDQDEAVLSVAHEALFRTWPRAHAMIEAERELLRIRSRVRGEAARWEREGRRPDLLLRGGRPLEEARLLVSASFTLTPAEADFVGASERQATRHRRIRTGASIAILILALAAGMFAWLADGRRRDAEVARTNAMVAKAKAERAEAGLQLERGIGELAERDDRRALERFEAALNLGGVDARARLLRGWAMRRLSGRAIPVAGHLLPVEEVAWSRDGRRVVSSDAAQMSIWDGESGDYVGSAPPGKPSPDARRVAVRTSSGVDVWDAVGEKIERRLQVDRGAVSDFDLGDRYLVAADDRDGLYCLDLETGHEIRGVFTFHNTYVLAEGERFVAGDKNAVRLYEIAKGGLRQLAMWELDDKPASWASARRAGAGFAIRTPYGGFRRWTAFDVQDPAHQEIGVPQSGYDDHPSSEDGKILAHEKHGYLGIYKASGEIVLSEFVGEFAAKSVSPDGRWVAAGTYDGQLLVWHVPTASLALRRRFAGNTICAIAMDARKRRVVVGFADGQVRIESIPFILPADGESESFSWPVSGSGSAELLMVDVVTGNPPR